MTEFLTNFHFARPFWLLLIIPAVVLFVATLRNSRQTSEWRSVIDAHLLPYLLDGKTVTASKLPLYGLLLAWIVASIALAGPVWKKLPQPLHEDVSALVVLWDLSPSMNAADVKPSRLVRSRLKLIDLLNERREGLTGLVAYAGEAHVVTPLTDDNETIINLLSSMSPEIMPLKGSNPEMAMQKAIELLNDAGVAKGDILFLTDGIAPSALHTLETLHEKSGHQVTVWGVGTRDGAPIPGMHGGFARDNSGEIVVAKLDESFLSEVASELGGLYVPFSNSEQDIRTIMNFSLKPTADLSRETTRLFDEWYEHGPWLLLALLPLAALAFRRGWLLSVAFLVIVLPPRQAQAFEWQDLWQTKDQQAADKLEQGDAESAAQTFADLRWKAIAKYKADNYEEAAKLFEQAENSAASYYNHGNALTHLSEYDKAIEAFNKALELNPNLEQAKKNRDIAEKLKQLQEQQQQQANQQQSDQSQQQDQQGDQQQQENQQQQGEQQQGEQQQNAQNQPGQQQSDQNDQQQNASGQQNQQQADANEPQQKQQDSSLSEEQKQALDRKYQSGEDEQSENNAPRSDEQQMQAQQPSEQNESPEGNDDQQTQAAIARMEEQEKSEEEQALEQWLRKVPDDPSGLLRNKLKYEYDQRRREFRSGDWGPPDNEANQRW